MKRYADGTEYKPRPTAVDPADAPAPLPMTRRQALELLAAAKALLTAVDEMTTLNFALGSDRPEREALRDIIIKIVGAR